MFMCSKLNIYEDSRKERVLPQQSSCLNCQELFPTKFVSSEIEHGWLQRQHLRLTKSVRGTHVPLRTCPGFWRPPLPASVFQQPTAAIY